VSVLVTGAFGFLGTWISERLANEGWTVFRAGRPETEIPSTEFDALLRRSETAAVVHCAAPASVPASIQAPARDRSGSLGVLAPLLRRLEELPIPPRFVLLSSAAVYGQPAELPISEEAPLEPMSPYGANRAESEVLVHEYARRSGAAATALRIFSAYGEGLRRQLLWDVSTKALAGGAVTLHGTGRETRDFVHAADVAQAVSIVLQYGTKLEGAYNVGAGRQFTVEELAHGLVDALGTNNSIVFSGAARVGDPVHWEADISRIAALGYSVDVSIEHGLEQYARWVSRAVA
jgi:UDP-glucose 4-epimerase